MVTGLKEPRGPRGQQQRHQRAQAETQQPPPGGAAPARPPRPDALRRPTGPRVERTGYGSAWLEQILPVAQATDIPGTGLRVLYLRLRAGLLRWILYVAALPSVVVPLGDGPAGQVLRDQLTAHRAGRLRYRRAQGVLFLPGTYAEYLRGRSRQALRTNLNRARDAGFTVDVRTVDGWSLQPHDPRYVAGRPPTPVEVWTVRDASGAAAGEAIVTVDERTALLHVLSSQQTYARWLLHAAIIEGLCGRCELMIVNAEDVPLLAPGARHYQRLLGYSIVRLRVRWRLTDLGAQPWIRIGLMCGAAAAVTVLSRLSLSAGASFAAHAGVWLTALTAVRRYSRRFGAAALAGALAALGDLCCDGSPHLGLVLAWVAAGLALDGLLAAVPRLTWGLASMLPAGAITAVIALVVAQLRYSGHRLALLHTPGASWGETVGCGAVAAVLGWWIGGRILQIVPVAAPWKPTREMTPELEPIRSAA